MKNITLELTGPEASFLVGMLDVTAGGCLDADDQKICYKHQSSLLQQMDNLGLCDCHGLVYNKCANREKKNAK